MEESLNSLEIEFKRIVNDLSFVAHRLESERRGVEDPVIVLVNRIAHLERKLKTIEEKEAQVKSIQAEIISNSVTVALQQHESLRKMYDGLCFKSQGKCDNSSTSASDTILNVEQLSAIAKARALLGSSIDYKYENDLKLLTKEIETTELDTPGKRKSTTNKRRVI
jgi:hypothetical protein